MDVHSAAVASLLAAAVLANLPFTAPRIGAARRAAALAGLYGAWVALSLVLQARAGQAHAMGWQAWAVSAAFFCVLAFPGLAWRYLRK